MRKEYLEALEEIKTLLKDDWVDSYWKPYYEVIKQALQCLEAIENANPSEALEIVDKIDNHLKYEWYQNKFLDLDICFATIKATLQKAQEQEKVLEIIKKHFNIRLLVEETKDDGVWGRLVMIQSKQDEGTWDTTATANVVDYKEEFELLKKWVG